MRAILSLASLTGLSALTACESVEVQYAAPARAGDYAAAESQAQDHYEFVALPKTYILVRPVDGSVGKSQNDDKPAAAKQADNGAAAAGRAAGAAPTAAANATPGLSTAVIDGKTWSATVIQLPDDQRTFVVRGVSGVWKSTTIGLTRTPNTDLVSSVSSTAENLAPKRIGQVASIVATTIQIAGTLAVSSLKPGEAPLIPFVVEVPGQGERSDTIPGDKWGYSFRYDSPELPPGTVTYEEFVTQGMNRKVAYWPIPACRSATLSIGTQQMPEAAVFHLVVSSSDVIRLQPLPSKGKVDFGSVCGATSSGTATSDLLTSVTDDLQAIQQAIKTIKDAKGAAKPAAAAPAGGSGGASPAAPKK